MAEDSAAQFRDTVAGFLCILRDEAGLADGLGSFAAGTSGRQGTSCRTRTCALSEQRCGLLMSGTRGRVPVRLSWGRSERERAPHSVQVPVRRQAGRLCALGCGGESALLRVTSAVGASVPGAVPSLTCVGRLWARVGGLGRVRPASGLTCFPHIVPREAN